MAATATYTTISLSTDSNVTQYVKHALNLARTQKHITETEHPEMLLSWLEAEATYPREDGYSHVVQMDKVEELFNTKFGIQEGPNLFHIFVTSINKIRNIVKGRCAANWRCAANHT